MKKITAFLVSFLFIVSVVAVNAKPKPAKKGAKVKKEQVVKKKPANYKIPNGKYESVNTTNNSIMYIYNFNAKTKLVKVMEEKGESEYAFACDFEGMTFYYLDGNRKASKDVAQKWVFDRKTKNFRMMGSDTIVMRVKKIYKMTAPNGLYEAYMDTPNAIKSIYKFNARKKLVQVMGEKDDVTYAFVFKKQDMVLYYVNAKKKRTKDVYETWKFDENTGDFYINMDGRKVLRKKTSGK